MCYFSQRRHSSETGAVCRGSCAPVVHRVELVSVLVRHQHAAVAALVAGARGADDANLDERALAEDADRVPVVVGEVEVAAEPELDLRGDRGARESEPGRQKGSNERVLMTKRATRRRACGFTATISAKRCGLCEWLSHAARARGARRGQRCWRPQGAAPQCCGRVRGRERGRTAAVLDVDRLKHTEPAAPARARGGSFPERSRR